MFVVDTNVLLYAADESAAEHPPCHKLVLGWRAQASPWFLTWGIVYEFLRVVTHPRVFRQPWSIQNAWAFVHALLASPSLSVLVEGERHPQIAATVLTETKLVRGNLVHDCHTAIIMREHGIKQIYTRDTDFNRFGGITVIDPLA